jgi:hypothetical protein
MNSSLAGKLGFFLWVVWLVGKWGKRKELEYLGIWLAFTKFFFFSFKDGNFNESMSKWQ